MHRLLVKTAHTEYPILIGTGLLSGEPPPAAVRAVLKGRSTLIVSDSNVGPLYGETLRALLLHAGASQAPLVTIPAGESSKNLGMLHQLYRAALSENLGRDCLITALGGGVAGDLAGLAAATFMRGVDFLQVPTSLLAMVDSSVGGKVGVDLEEGKNLVGAFHHPQLVLTDVEVLKTLPDRELRCGLAEIVKYGLIMDAELFEIIEQSAAQLADRNLALYQTIIKRCCKLKAQVVAEDERELSGRRAILNYGHTFGHALECLTGYQTLNHGEAIAIGMVMAAELGMQLGSVDREFADRQEAILKKLGLPVEARGLGVSATAVFEALGHDKKARRGTPRFIIPKGVGSVFLSDEISEPQVLEAIRRHCE